jgi:hypothetical protein
MASRAEWAKRVERWDRSGLRAEAFAEREGLKVKQLYWWRWKLRSSLPAATPQRSEAPPVEFLPVRVVGSAMPTTSAGSPIEIALPNGRVVRVAAGFDPAMLGRVLSIASEDEPC